MKHSNKMFVLTLLVAGAVQSGMAASRPNVIVIYADDMGSGDLSILNKESKFQTPHMDALARSGVNFTDAHTVSSVSTPSRYGILTGEYSWRSSLKAGVTWGFSEPLIPADKPTVATMMKRAGYQTACVGKWHLGLGWTTNDGKVADKDGTNVCYDKPLSHTPTSRGFDYFYGMSASLDIPPYVIIENERVVKQPNARYEETTFNEHDNEPIANPFLRAGDYVKGEGPEDFLPKYTNKVKELIKDYSRTDDPFFIYFALTAPHAPLAPNKKFLGKSGIGLYGDFMLEVDDVVGQVVAELKKRKVLDDTIIILSSDNGAERFAYYRLAESGHNSSGVYKGVKRDLWEGGHRVPFIVSWGDKFKGGSEVNQTICVSDIYATLADITGVELADGEAQDSYSLMPLITGKDKYKREYTVHHSSSGRFAIRKGDWVLIEAGLGDDNRWLDKIDYYDILKYDLPKELPKGELFNIKEDIEQRVSHYDDKPQIVAEFTAILDEITKGWGTRRDRYMKSKK
ncbi:MAG: arylsulfatase [Rikenellaceae bacterium]